MGSVGERLTVAHEASAEVRRGTIVGSTVAARFFRSMAYLPRWAWLALAVVLAACNNGGGGTGY